MEHELIRRARKEGAPLIDSERAQATFVWRGRLSPQLIGDFNEWCADDAAEPREPVALTEIESGVWACTLPFPPDAYIEYSYTVEGRRVLDPLNPHATPNGMGDTNNFFYMPEAAATPLAQRQRGVARGELTRHAIQAGDLIVGGRRAVQLYSPATREPCPLLIVLDGHDYLRRARITHIVDNLIAQGRIQPLALALVDSSPSARFLEYACSDATVGFLVDIVLPLAREQLNLVDVRRWPGAYGVLGSSMGGVMALYAACRVPEVFGHAFSQSGAFTAGNRDLVIFDLLRQGGRRPLHLYIDVGRLESLLECNRRMYELLSSKGYDVNYREYNGGHNFPAWRDDLGRGLEVLYGPR